MNLDPLPVSRRELLAAATGLVAAASSARAATPAGPLKVSIFSKHLLFLEGDALAQRAAEIGFDGIDLAVRKGGHVEPPQVAQDLPKLVEIIRRHGLEVQMLTTDIVDADSPYAEDILRTMHGLGIRYYRWGGFRYDYSKPMASQLEALKPRVARLAALNKRYGATAMYHTHSGIGLVGAPIWDLYIVLKDFDPNAVAVNYDVGHATIEGGFGGWIDSFYISEPHLRGIAVKDFMWEKNGKGEWKAEFVALGAGMVHFPKFFGMVKQSGFSGPLQLHFEYPLGGANNGARKLTISQDELFSAMRRDLKQLRTYLKDAGLSA
ncbi:MAG TPA: TIM barrel protein [Bryobacteraceae bacterium]|nr:TIM barrel protein [Bryobacteraceae bacterium]